MSVLLTPSTGLIQVDSAINNKVEVSPSYLSLPTGESRNSVFVSFTNTGNRRVAYRLGHTPAVAVSTEDAWYGQVGEPLELTGA